jgi:hypothetical protein
MPGTDGAERGSSVEYRGRTARLPCRAIASNSRPNQCRPDRSSLLHSEPSERNRCPSTQQPRTSSGLDLYRSQRPSGWHPRPRKALSRGRSVTERIGTRGEMIRQGAEWPVGPAQNRRKWGRGERFGVPPVTATRTDTRRGPLPPARNGTGPLKIRARMRPAICILEPLPVLRSPRGNPCPGEAFGKGGSNVGNAPADFLCRSGFFGSAILRTVSTGPHWTHGDGRSVLVRRADRLLVPPEGGFTFYTPFRHLMDRHHG